MFCCTVSGEVDREAHAQAAAHRHHLLADPGQWEERNELVGVLHRVDRQEVGAHADQVLMGQHCPLGLPGRARGVTEDRHVRSLTQGQLSLEEALVLLTVRPAEHLHLRKPDQLRIVVAAQPLRVVPNDPLHLRELVEHVEQLVDLLLVLHDHETGVRMIDDELHLARDGILIQPHRSPTRGLSRELRVHPFGPVVAHDRDLVAAAKPERDQPQTEVANVTEVGLPAHLSPDPQLLLSECRPRRAQPLRLCDEKLGQGVRFAHDAVSASVSCPRYAWITSGSRRTSSGVP
jgi:hypothetical protein